MRTRLLAILFVAACSSPASSPDGGASDGALADAPGRDAPAVDADRDGAVPAALRCPSVPSEPRIGAELPRDRVDLTMPPPGTVHAVTAGGDLQAAIDAASSGDVIELAAGATFTGPFTLRDHAGDGWVVIRSGGALPAEGARVGPSDAAAMARIVAPAGQPAITAADHAHHYRLVGLEITTATDAYTTALVDLGSSAATIDAVPHHLIVDRCYLHGAATAGTRRGIAMNSAYTAVIESYFTDFREMGADSQAICGWTGPGPFGIYDNFLAGAAENVMFGGAASHGPAFDPADIEVCGNHFDKPLAWYEMGPSYAGLDWVNKNLFELKNARRVLLAGNVLEHSWGDGQVGYAILLTPRGEGDPSLAHAVQDVTVVDNVIHDVGGGVSILSRDDGTPGSLPAQRILVAHNIFRIDGPAWNGVGRAFAITYGGDTADRIGVIHNTVRLTGNAAVVFGDATPIATGVILENNLLEHGDYGVFGSGQGEGRNALDYYVPGAIFAGNAIYGGGTEASYPTGNFFPATVSDVGFVDPMTDLRLSTSSPYRTSATDGTAIGADVDAVLAATAGAAP